MRVLVTGGAGYIGSHAVYASLLAGHGVTVLDDLSTGHRDAVHPDARFVLGSVSDPAAVASALEGCDAVMHFAARSIVSESVREPLLYWRVNVGGAIQLLTSMQQAGVRRLIFSSTAATYGIPDHVPIPETCPQRPINPYGSSKLAIEQLVRELAATDPGFGFAILRYFNVAGAAWGLAERHEPETHLIPLVLQAASGARPGITVFGTDYDTPDGTCIRDYVHVHDLVDAHLRVLDALGPGEARVYNIGTGTGWSVREVIDAAREVTGRDFPVALGERRAGDPPALVTDPARIQAELGWRAERSSLASMIGSAWSAPPSTVG